MVVLRKSPAGFGFRVSDDLLVEGLTDATGLRHLDPPFPLGWYVRKCDSTPVHNRADLTDYLNYEEVAFTLEPPRDRQVRQNR